MYLLIIPCILLAIIYRFHPFPIICYSVILFFVQWLFNLNYIDIGPAVVILLPTIIIIILIRLLFCNEEPKKETDVMTDYSHHANYPSHRYEPTIEPEETKPMGNESIMKQIIASPFDAKTQFDKYEWDESKLREEDNKLVYYAFTHDKTRFARYFNRWMKNPNTDFHILEVLRDVDDDMFDFWLNVTDAFYEKYHYRIGIKSHHLILKLLRKNNHDTSKVESWY